MPSNTSISFKKKAYNSSTDNVSGVVVFDNTTQTIWVGGVQYSKVPNRTKSSVFTSFTNEYTANNRLSYFCSDSFVNSIDNYTDNSYNLIVLNNTLVTTLSTDFYLDIDLPVMSMSNNTYTGGENIHYFLIYNSSSSDIEVTLSPKPSTQTVTVIGDIGGSIEIGSGKSVEISIKVIGSYWVVTKSAELNLIGTINPL